MLEDIVIKIEKQGKNSKPSYNLILKGTGELKYIGLSNVKNLGEIEDKIKEDEFLEILSIFKEIDFFSYRDDFRVDRSSPRPYTTISITLPVNGKKTKTTTITYHDDDVSVPNDLIELEKNIKKISGSEKWINVSEYKQTENLKAVTKKSSDIRPKRKLKTFAIVIFVIIIITAGVFLLLVKDNTDNEQYDQVLTTEFIYIATTNYNKRYDGVRATENNFFTQGDTVYVDFEVEKFFDYPTNITSEITVTEKEKIYYYKHSQIEVKPANEKGFYSIIGFPTNVSWPSQQTYNIKINLVDESSSKNCSGSTTFSLSSPDNPSTKTLIANIVQIKVIDNLSIYFEGDASGGTGTYSYNWTFKDLDGNLIGTSIGKTGTYDFEEVDIIEIILLVNDSENTDTHRRYEYIK